MRFHTTGQKRHPMYRQPSHKSKIYKRERIGVLGPGPAPYRLTVPSSETLNFWKILLPRTTPRTMKPYEVYACINSEPFIVLKAKHSDPKPFTHLTLLNLQNPNLLRG